MRGLARTTSDERFADPIARDLVPQPYAWAIDLAHRFPAVWDKLEHAADVASFFHFSHVAMRTRAIDDVVKAAVAGGAEQIVILGAGLDARAWRLPELRDRVVFEVDHPATQAYKRAKIQGHSSLAREVRFVAVDFERDALDARLQNAGFDAARRSVFIWEGVTMYLHPEAVQQTLSLLAKLAAAGSTLLVTYAKRYERSVALQAVRWIVRSSGEPFRALYSPDEMKSTLASHGFHVAADEGLSDWVRRYRHAEGPDSLERLAHAVRKPSE